MIRDKIKSAYNSLAKNYSAMIDYKAHNALYDRPNTLSLFGDVNGKFILDAACGPGKYAEELIEKGAIVSGFDFSEEMVKYAKERNKEKGTFFTHDLEAPLSMFDNESFDYVLCTLALHYLADWTSTIKEFCRVLRPEGSLIISIEHPFFEYNYYKAKNYFAKEAVKCTWRGFGDPVEINSYRRSLQDCIQPLTENGFYIDKILEPLPLPEFEISDPKHFNELNEFPAFLCIRGKKR